MKVITKRDGEYVWIALKDKKGLYHCWFDPEMMASKSFYLAGHVYTPATANRIKQLIKKEERNDYYRKD